MCRCKLIGFLYKEVNYNYTGDMMEEQLLKLLEELDQSAERVATQRAVVSRILKEMGVEVEEDKL